MIWKMSLMAEMNKAVVDYTVRPTGPKPNSIRFALLVPRPWCTVHNLS